MSISAIILTYNESVHIKRCLESIVDVVEKIYVVDSFSTDSTLSILSEFENVEVFQRKFLSHAEQLNAGLEHFNIKSEWVIRIDSDEFLDSELASFLKNDLYSIDDNVNGVYFNRYICFFGKVLKYGGMSSYWNLRMWRTGYAKCEQRLMDEHMILSEGNIIKSPGKLIDHNLNSFGWWIKKHIDYATKEAIEIILHENQDENVLVYKYGKDWFRKKLKNRYNSLPLFIRPILYYIYRYIIRMGFLDGRQGFIWCFMQALWYRMMVDVKVYEIKSYKDEDYKTTIKKLYGYDI